MSGRDVSEESKEGSGERMDEDELAVVVSANDRKDQDPEEGRDETKVVEVAEENSSLGRNSESVSDEEAVGRPKKDLNCCRPRRMEVGW